MNLPKIAIVIELDNLRFSTLNRLRRLLRSLDHQILQLTLRPVAPVEIILVFDQAMVDDKIVSDVVRECLTCGERFATVKQVSSAGLRYYEQKNLGGQLSCADLTVFIDSDVVPEAGWLEAILEPFSNPDIEVVAGETHVEPSSFFGRAAALYWIFPIRSEMEGLTLTARFHANNVAFRTSTFKKYPFPDMSGFRVQCVQLAAQLNAAQVGIYCQKKARASHPCPSGITYFAARALHKGRDDVLLQQMRNCRGDLKATYFIRGFFKNLQTCAYRIRRDRRALRVSAAAGCVMFFLGTAYFALQAVGSLLTLVSRNATSRVFTP